MDIKEKALSLHTKLKGKIEVVSRGSLTTQEDLALLYSPGVASPCLEIHKNPDLSYQYTRRHNLIAVITDGTAVLGLGDIGPLAAMPVMEGKAILFKRLADVDAFPLSIASKSVDEIVHTIKLLENSFGGINLEDISAPRCFEIEKRLKETCGIPIFHDDQHGTAIVVTAALINSIKRVNKTMDTLKIVVNGAGAAGTAITTFLLEIGVHDVTVCDRFGILNANDPSLSMSHHALALKTNPRDLKGSLLNACKGADVLVGVSAEGAFHPNMIEVMNHQPIVFALANPIPEILPEEAYAAGAVIVGTGSSRYPNQINNVLAFPGVFRGTLDSHSKAISKPMMFAAAQAIASCVQKDELEQGIVIPKALDKQVHQAVAAAVYLKALEENHPKTHP